MDKEKAKENRMVQQFFKNKVFWGIDSVPLKRKIYRGKRDKNGYRKNECFYVCLLYTSQKLINISIY